MHMHMYVERADKDYVSRDARLERAFPPCQIEDQLPIPFTLWCGRESRKIPPRA